MRYQPTKIDIFFIITKHWVEILLFFTPLASVMSFYGMFPPWFIVFLPHGLLCFSPWFIVLPSMVYSASPHGLLCSSPWFVVLLLMVYSASPHVGQCPCFMSYALPSFM